MASWMPIFSVQGSVVGDGGLDLLRRVERIGADAFLVPDHPGVCPSPYVDLAAAALGNDRVRLGTYVANAGLRDPVQLAVDVATLDRLSGGRALFGIGAGHTPGEWQASGLAFPSAAARVERLAEMVEVVPRLLAGEVVTFSGNHLRLSDAVLVEPLPVQDRVPLLIGGNNRSVLRLASRHADIVGITGTGKTLADGHHHEVKWSLPHVDAMVDLIDKAVTESGRTGKPELEALIQHVELTDDREKVAAGIAAMVPGLSEVDAMTAPYLLFGTAPEMADHLSWVQQRWGITRFVVRPAALDAIEAVQAVRAG